MAPFRKVVQSRRDKFGNKTEVLECGHLFAAGNVNDGRPSNRGTTASRRRCYECSRVAFMQGEVDAV